MIKLLSELKLEYYIINTKSNRFNYEYNQKEFNNIILKIKKYENIKNKNMKQIISEILNYNQKKINFFINNCNYTDYLKANAELSIKYYPIDNFLDEEKQNYIIKGESFNYIIEELYKYSKQYIKLNCLIIKIIKKNNLWYIINNNNNIYITHHIISTIDIKALDNINIKGVNINYFKEHIGTNNFLKIYTFHDKIELKNNLIIPHIFKQMIPIDNNILLLYSDNLNAIKSYYLLNNINNRKLSKIINKFIISTPVKDKIIKYWHVGSHNYKPLYNYNKNYFYENNFSIVGVKLYLMNKDRWKNQYILLIIGINHNY